MILTVGYARLTPGKLWSLVQQLRVDALYDCRSLPRSRKAGFSRSALTDRFGSLYSWHPDLGGRDGAPTADAIKALAVPHPTRNILLLCLEEAPGECHRHLRIAVPLLGYGIDAYHVYRNEVVRASALQRAIDEDGAYTYEPLSGFARRRRGDTSFGPEREGTHE